MFTASKDSNLTDVKPVSSNLSGDGKDAFTSVSDTANSMGRKVRKLYNAASEEITDDIDIVTSQIRKKPVQSSVIALGVGFLLGTLFRRI